MSSFSSVVQKPGKKIAPKAAPRRNIARKIVQPAQEPVQETNEVPQPAQDDDQPGATSRVQHLQSSPPPNAIPEIIPSVEPVSSTVIETDHTAPRTTNPSNTETETYSRSFSSQRRSPQVLNTIPSISVSGSQSPQSSRGQKRKLGHTDSADRGNRDVSADQVPTEASKRQTLRQRSRTSTTPIQTSTSISVSPTAVRNAVARRASRSSSRQDQDTVDIFNSVTERAASISELANDIDSQTRAQQARSRTSATNEAIAEQEGTGVPNSATPSTTARAKRTRKKKQTIQEQAAEVVANVVGQPDLIPRKRNVTPADAEDYELEPGKTTMGELTKDRRVGKKSTLEAEMQANWPEILRRRKEDRDLALKNAEKRRRKAFSSLNLDLPREPTLAIAPVMRIVDGQIVVDTDSRVIDRGAQLAETAVQDIDNVREDRDYYKRVNQATVGMKAGHGNKSRWDEDSTELFYKGLRMFGTDFMMISAMFPHLTRKQIKTKYTREESSNRAKVQESLRNKEPVDMDFYSDLAKKEFVDPKTVDEELKQEEQKLRDEDVQRRRREGFIQAETGDHTRPAGEAERAEQDANGDSTEAGGPQSPRSERLRAMASSIVNDAISTTKKRQSKASMANSKKRGPKGANKAAAGIEERLGTIDEVQV